MEHAVPLELVLGHSGLRRTDESEDAAGDHQQDGPSPPVRPRVDHSPQDAPFTGPHRRVLYAAVLNWGADGATPHVGAFL